MYRKSIVNAIKLINSIQIFRWKHRFWGPLNLRSGLEKYVASGCRCCSVDPKSSATTTETISVKIQTKLVSSQCRFTKICLENFENRLPIWLKISIIPSVFVIISQTRTVCSHQRINIKIGIRDANYEISMTSERWKSVEELRLVSVWSEEGVSNKIC